MTQTATGVLPSPARVTEQLLARFGPDKLSQIEQLSPRIYRAHTIDGTLILATVGHGGELFTREVEMLA